MWFRYPKFIKEHKQIEIGLGLEVGDEEAAAMWETAGAGGRGLCAFVEG